MGGFVLWPPTGLALYVNDTLTPPSPDSQPVSPFWEFDPPLAGGVYLRMCVATEKKGGEKEKDASAPAPAPAAAASIKVHKGLSFT